MDYHILKLGYSAVTREVLLAGEGASQAWVPIYAVLVKDANHTILFDTGCNDERPGNLPYRCPPGEGLLPQLALYNTSVADVDTVVVSHYHADHFGGLHHFSDCHIVAPREGARRFFSGWERCALVARHEELELTPQIRILSLPGHADNVLGMLLDTGSEKILFPSDAAYTPLNFGPPVRLPGLCADPLEYRASMERIGALAKEENCKIFWSHWPVEGM
ncbi:MAG: MBL fold metallo-hydrolase [Eubacteriales bacterium]|nr:MBL fold metallo-hydrolase [Eubacteriales bacterium]